MRNIASVGSRVDFRKINKGSLQKVLNVSLNAFINSDVISLKHQQRHHLQQAPLQHQPLLLRLRSKYRHQHLDQLSYQRRALYLQEQQRQLLGIKKLNYQRVRY